MKLLFIAIILGVGLILLLCWKYKVKIKLKTFFKKGFRPKRGNFGVYCYDGKQGKGKTYSLVEYLLDNRNSSEIFCNIKGIKNIDYKYYTGFDGLIDLKNQLDYDTLVYDKEKQLVIVYDEIFTELQKNSKLSKDIIDFLCQMRKRKIIFLTTAQEWAEIPLSFRRFVRYEIQCQMIPILNTGILIKRFGDAENMKWSEEEQEHVSPIVETSITKCRKFVADSYDTNLRISSTEDVKSSVDEEYDKDFDIDFWEEEHDSLIDREQLLEDMYIDEQEKEVLPWKK